MNQLTTRVPAALLLFLSAACEHPLAVAPLRDAPIKDGNISLRLTVVSPVNEQMRARCADEVYAGLRRGGVVVSEAGTEVEVELWLVPDTAMELMAPRMELGTQEPRTTDIYRAPVEPSFTAEAKATVRSPAGPKTFRVAGPGSRSPCDAVAERLAAALTGRP